MESVIKWHYLEDEGYPEIKDDRTHTYLVCVRYNLAFDTGFGKIPTGETMDICEIAMIQRKETHSGCAYTPSMKFFFGPYIFHNVYAWAEFPKAAPYKGENNNKN